nr:immunoglobulin light chain junction region [Macaca mulatta]
CQQYINSPFTF